MADGCSLLADRCCLVAGQRARRYSYTDLACTGTGTAAAVASASAGDRARAGTELRAAGMTKVNIIPPPGNK